MTAGDVAGVAVLTRDRDAWQALALQSLAVLQQLQGMGVSNWLGEHDRQMYSIEHELILKALAHCGGNKVKTAAYLGVAYKTLNYKLKFPYGKIARRVAVVGV